MNEIKLLPHNQDMVEGIEKAMVEGNRKIFYTEATGLGKSFIFMYLVHKYFKNKKVLYIAPKNHIWYNMTGYKEFELIKDCVTFICNADFNKIKPRHKGFDAIFIDEAHHLTAPIQGENISTLVDMTIANNPNAYVFGFTATPYVDDKMIGDEYFDTSVIGMDLFDAIDNKLLQKINYAVAVKEDIELSDEEKSLAIKYNVDTTSVMVTDIVNQYSNVNHWLAYFPFIGELEENIEYFERYFPDYKIFAIHSEIENSEKILKEFENYNGKAILASVSMVLEGIHPKSVEGILLYRNVCSNNTFFQIIGRLGIMKSDANPICIDVYEAYNNLITSNKIINKIDFARNSIGKKCIRDYLYMSSNTYRFLELSNIIYNLRYDIRHEYRGITWTTDADLSRKLGKSEPYVNRNIRKGKTYEEIIDYILDDKFKLYRGITWHSQSDLSRKLGMNTSYVCSNIHRGKTYEEIIDHVLDNVISPKTYRGITWTTDADLSRKLGKGDAYVTYHIRRGETYEEIIDHALDNVISPKTYRGITWTTDADLSRKLGKARTYINRCRRNDETYEEIIDHVIDNISPKTYRGITWTTDADLSRKLGKNISTIYHHLRNGKTCKEIIDYILDGKTCNNYRDLTWTTDADLSRKLGKNDTYVHCRRRIGKTYEEIIDHALDNVISPKTYRGITWTTDADLSRKLNRNKQHVYHYISIGKTYEEIIDHVLDNVISPKTYRGITWTTDADLSRKLGKNYIYVNQNIRRGKTYEEIIDYCLDKGCTTK